MATAAPTASSTAPPPAPAAPTHTLAPTGPVSGTAPVSAYARAAVAHPVTVAPVVSKGDLRAFVQLPFDLYAGHPYWVPTLRRDTLHALDPEKNAFFEHGNIQPFIARDASGRVVGRIAAIYNGAHAEKYRDGVGFFGFFETVEDEAVSAALLDAVAAWSRSLTLTALRGPANPSLNDIAGLLVGGFDRLPSLMMPYNPAYYADFLARYGFTRAMTMWAYYVHKKYVREDKMHRGVALVRRRYPGLTIRTLDMSRLDEEAATILDIYNEAWSENWGHVPMRPAEFAQLVKEMKQIVDPRIVFLIEDAGVPVAFTLSLPNLNLVLRHVTSGRLFPTGAIELLARSKAGAVYECRNLLMGVRKAYHGRGLDAMLNVATIIEGPASGYDACEMSWVLDVNTPLRNAMDHMGAVIDKEYAMVEKAI